MALNTDNKLPDWIFYLDTIDSTNNYAMRRIEDGLAQHGEVICTSFQTEGKGQRGKRWDSEIGKNIMMSLIAKLPRGQKEYFGLSMLVSISLTEYLRRLLHTKNIYVKWPNDIYINDKKTSGILIENIFRGMNWEYSVIGIGVNVNQSSFLPELSKATSLHRESGEVFDIFDMIVDIRSGILNALRNFNFHNTWEQYNELLYAKNSALNFEEIQTGRRFEGFIQEVDQEGKLVLLTYKGIEKFENGILKWEL